MILYNGATGGLGRYLSTSLISHGQTHHALTARLEDRVGLRAELEGIPVYRNEPVTFIHLAALVSVPYCEAHPQLALKTNVVDTSNTVRDVVVWARDRHLPVRVLYVSTGHVYAERKDRIDETDVTRPLSIYANTKLAAENSLAGVCQRSATPYTIARVFGLLSPGQAEPYLLPALIRRVKDKDHSPVPGLGNIRDYLDARDVCRALTLLAIRPAVGTQIFNVCSGLPVSVGHLLNLVHNEITDKTHAVLFTSAPGRASDLHTLVGNPNKLVHALGTSVLTIPLLQTVRDAVKAQR